MGVGGQILWPRDRVRLARSQGKENIYFSLYYFSKRQFFVLSYSVLNESLLLLCNPKVLVTHITYIACIYKDDIYYVHLVYWFSEWFNQQSF